MSVAHEKAVFRHTQGKDLGAFFSFVRHSHQVKPASGLSLLVVFFLLFLYAPVSWAKAFVKAKQDHVKIYTKANKSAPVEQELQKGDTVVVHNRVGMFWEVESASGKLGYVSVLSVHYAADGNSSEGLSSALHNAIQQNREDDESAQVRVRSSVMGVRALDASKETESIATMRPNARGVYEMEDRVVSPSRLTHLAEEIAAEIEHRAQPTSTRTQKSSP